VDFLQTRCTGSFFLTGLSPSSTCTICCEFAVQQIYKNSATSRQRFQMSYSSSFCPPIFRQFRLSMMTFMMFRPLVVYYCCSICCSCARSTHCRNSRAHLCPYPSPKPNSRRHQLSTVIEKINVGWRCTVLGTSYSLLLSRSMFACMQFCSGKLLS